jgi:hypothetical protein
MICGDFSCSRMSQTQYFTKFHKVDFEYNNEKYRVLFGSGILILNRIDNRGLLLAT